ncbi:MAG: hypothetical protein HY973_00880 [Candidatus Kerfeldbacteria bacterium]|nr:hypothetical protein [Candidatus Kerfeldbacteria bacterium]
MDKNKHELGDPFTQTCSVCGGEGKTPNPHGSKKSTCPYCKGSGIEPKEPLTDEIEDDED